MLDYTEYFVIDKRKRSGEEFVILANQAPQELKDLVTEIHVIFVCSPNFWIYATILRAFEELEGNKLDDISIEADLSDHQVVKWLNNEFAFDYCDGVMKDIGLITSFDQLIACAQEAAMRDIYRIVYKFLEIERGSDCSNGEVLI